MKWYLIIKEGMPACCPHFSKVKGWTVPFKYNTTLKSHVESYY